MCYCSYLTCQTQVIIIRCSCWNLIRFISLRTNNQSKIIVLEQGCAKLRRLFTKASRHRSHVPLMCGVGSLKYHARTVETETCLKSCCEICFLAAVVVLILGVFSVPIVVFYVKVHPDDTAAQYYYAFNFRSAWLQVGEQPIPPTVVSTTDPSGSACRQNGPPSNSTNCSSYSWADRVSSAVNCTAVPYTGGVCRGHLSAWQQCALGQSDSVWINNTGNMTAAETNAAIIINLLSEFLECPCPAIVLCHNNRFIHFPCSQHGMSNCSHPLLLPVSVPSLWVCYREHLAPLQGSLSSNWYWRLQSWLAAAASTRLWTSPPQLWSLSKCC